MGCQQERGDNSVLGGVELTLSALLEFSANFNDGSFIAFWLFGGFFVTSETQAGISGLRFFWDRQLERLVFICKQDWFQNLRAAI